MSVSSEKAGIQSNIGQHMEKTLRSMMYVSQFGEARYME